MSRNLGRTDCKFCHSAVTLDEEPRLITPEEAGCYYATYQGYGYAGAIMANATCAACGAKYLAWVSLQACEGYRGGWGRVDGAPFFDLSFRAAFNDEPAEDDLPDWEVSTVELTAEQCRKLEVISGSVKRRRPWPRCDKTGRKIDRGYGCDCAEHRLLGSLETLHTG